MGVGVDAVDGMKRVVAALEVAVVAASGGMPRTPCAYQWAPRSVDTLQ